MQNVTVSRKRLVDFRLEVYASFTFRADALFELVDALLLSPIVRSAVEVSQSPIFRRRFASVYDALANGQIDPAALRQPLVAAEPPEALTVAGDAVYALDTTIAPREVERVPSARTPGEVGAEQVQRLAADPTPTQPKAVVVDSHYPVPSFLRAFVGRAPDVVVLVRLAANRVLYGPAPPPTGTRGRPAVHGARLVLRAPIPPHRQETVRLLGQEVRVSAWAQQHLRAVPALVGLVVRVEFLRADGTPRYKRPLWLCWSGPQEIILADLVRMYLLRFTIEHFFRFAKQKLGLLVAHLGDIGPIETWVQVVALAYGQLLLARDMVQPTYRPWDPTARQDPNRPLTPGQVLAAWPIFSRTLATPATVPRRAGKAPGRAPGDQPQPRERHPVAKARNRRLKAAA